MKLRRAMAVAAATAVIAPAAFFAAPAAFATEGDPATPQTSAETPGSETPDTETPEAGAGETGETPPVVETPPTDEAPAPPETEEETPATPPTEPEEEGAPEAGKPSPSASQSTPGAAPSATSTGEAPGSPIECDDDSELTFDENLKTSLTGLPERIVAGSGFHGFKFNVSNKGKNIYTRVDLAVFASQIDEKTWEDTSRHLTLQYKDPESGQWINISLDDNDEGAGYLGYTDIRSKESFSVDLRLSVDKSAPAGFGYAIGIGIYADDKGNCVLADDFASYEFDIAAAGTDAGDPGEATPQPQPRPQTGGKKPIPAKPVGNTEIKPQGHLAETGSSSTVPVIGMVGGIAVVAGAGVMFAMKRRRDGDAAA
ncbi:LAETG motif-containing sortase-dependent surface protein [Streptomyces sp. NPDC127033]|uniref:LAETG motif-containing sortase-dependent surface protein n=1 Tax=Streptomyces sp. NPDC127033 TaxID=3347110 RepID=UPI0036663840